MSMHNAILRVPCSYQGGKQRIAAQIVDRLLASAGEHVQDVHFYDLCCGSGAITLGLLNRGVQTRQITMLDMSSWGAFWEKIGSGAFDLEAFKCMLADIPQDKRQIKSYMTQLAMRPIDETEAYIYPILQSCSFGGKQIWLENGVWKNAFFRDYWEPTPNSVRKSPANPMQPSPQTLFRRIANIVNHCEGLTCLRCNAMDFAKTTVPSRSIVYIDPPYAGTTSYGFELDIETFVTSFTSKNDGPLFVSEAIPLSEFASQLALNGANGGISGHRKRRNEEWLSMFGTLSL